MSKVFRFSGNLATGTTPILYSDLMSLIVIGIDGTHVSNIFDNVKLSKVEIWLGSHDNSVSSISLELPSNDTYLGSRSIVITDTSTSTAEPAHICMKVPRTASQYFWQTTSSLVAFNLIAPSSQTPNAVIDVSLSYTVSDDGSALPTSVVGAATASTVYYRALDNAANLKPVLLPTV